MSESGESSSVRTEDVVDELDDLVALDWGGAAGGIASALRRAAVYGLAGISDAEIDGLLALALPVFLIIMGVIFVAVLLACAAMGAAEFLRRNQYLVIVLLMFSSRVHSGKALCHRPKAGGRTIEGPGGARPRIKGGDASS